jgi:hypothetical protein
MIMGGEGSVRNILYPFVSEVSPRIQRLRVADGTPFCENPQPNNKPIGQATNEERELLS